MGKKRSSKNRGQKKRGYVDIGKGVRQGCLISLNFFSLYTQLVIDKLAEFEGMRIGDRIVIHNQYADYKWLIADLEEKLQHLVSYLHEGYREESLRIHRSKTGITVLTKRNASSLVNGKF